MELELPCLTVRLVSQVLGHEVARESSETQFLACSPSLACPNQPLPLPLRHLLVGLLALELLHGFAALANLAVSRLAQQVLQVGCDLDREAAVLALESLGQRLRRTQDAILPPLVPCLQLHLHV